MIVFFRQIRINAFLKLLFVILILPYLFACTSKFKSSGSGSGGGSSGSTTTNSTPGTINVAITSPTTNSYINSSTDSATFSISGTCDTNAATIVIKVDGSSVTTTNGTCNGTTFSATIDSTAITEATHSVTAYISNASSNATSTAISVTRDITTPQIASATVLNLSPTQSRGYFLSYGSQTNGTYSHYCILENSTTVASCSWTAGTLPSEYTIPATDAAYVLSFWIKDAAGNVSARVDTNSVTFDRRNISGGAFHYCWLNSSGTVKCWGSDDSGQLGDYGVGYASTVPYFVRNSSNNGNLTNATAITTGYKHTCAILTDKTVQCWGENTFGELGDGNVLSSSNLPVSISGISSAVSIASSVFTTCVLLENQTVKCWGKNQLGTIGDNTTTTAYSPTTVKDSTGTGTLSNVIELTGSDESICALLTDRTVQCWGSDLYGQTAQNTSGSFYKLPKTVKDAAGSGTLSNVIQITGLNGAFCALISGGSVYCWGYNIVGQLGINNQTEKHLPNQVKNSTNTGFLSNVTKLMASSTGYNICALFADTTAQCWGKNDYGTIPDGVNSSAVTLPSNLKSNHNINSNSLSNILIITFDYYTGCTALTTDTISCWGTSYLGETGTNTYNTTYDYVIPTVTNISTPTISSASILSNNNDQYTDTTNVTINLNVYEGTNYTYYCVLENDTDVNHCTWVHSAPSSYTITSSVNSTIQFYVWTKNIQGNVSARYDVSELMHYDNLVIRNKYSGSTNYFLQYVKSSDTTTLCGDDYGTISTNLTTGLSDCIHSGEAKKVTVNTNYTTTCTGWTMTDNLSVFDWTCSDNGGIAVFSSKLKSTSKLSDLIDFSNAQYKNISVTLTNGITNYTSTQRVLWNDNFEYLHSSLNNTGYGSITNNSTIYIEDDNLQIAGADVFCSNCAIVIKPTKTIYPDKNNLPTLCNANMIKCIFNFKENTANFWIEGSFDGFDTNQNVVNSIFYFPEHISLVRLDNVYLYHATDFAILTYRPFGHYYNKVNISGGITKGGIYINEGLFVTIANSMITNNYDGIDILKSNNISIVKSVVSGSANTNLSITDSNKINIVASTISSGKFGIEIFGGSSESNYVFHNLLTANVDNGLTDYSQVSQAFLSQSITEDNISYDISLGANFTKDYNNAYTNVDPGGTAGSNTANANNITAYGSTNAELVFAASSDSTNPVGSISKAFDSLGNYGYFSQWFTFDNDMRTWFKENSNNPSMSDAMCAHDWGVNTLCQIWDFSVKSSSTKNKNKSGNLSTSNDAYVANASCPSQSSSLYQTNTGYTSSNSDYYLKNAIEIIGYGNGNFDGLCQPGETCLYTPNIGAYQGHGNLSHCTFDDSNAPFTNTGMTYLYGYDSNGR